MIWAVHSLDALTLLDAVADSICIVDGIWQISYANTHAIAEMARGTGLVGMDLWEAVPGIEGSNFGEVCRRCMADRLPRDVEGYFAPLGNWLSIRAIPLSEGLAVLFRTITPQKQSESALRTSEQRFRAMFDTLGRGILFYDGDGRITDANPAAERILGFGFAEMEGLSSGDARWRAVDEADNFLPANMHPTNLALHTGQRVQNFIMGIFNPILSERRWISVDANPLFGGEGPRPSQVYTVFEDITEKRQAEYELRQSKLHLALAQRVASIGSAAIDFRTGKWDWSDETYRIYGVKRESFTPSAPALASLVHPDDRNELLSKPALARRGVTPPPIEYRIKRPDGAERILRREATLARDDKGKVVGIVGTVQDVTDQRAAQREKYLLETQLHHAQRLDALGTLASGIAHDLNNTLVPVLALSEAVAKSLPKDDTRRPLVELIHQAGERARDLVAQVLAFARPEKPESRTIDVETLLHETMGLVRASIPTSIEIVERINSVSSIFGDAGKLHQVLVNLFANAASAIGVGPGKIEISVAETYAEPLDNPNGNMDFCVIISITDSGCGMDETTQARIFEPFFTTKRVGAGTGLGLSIAHGIVAAHGGHIRVASHPGRGSRFDVILPVAK